MPKEDQLTLCVRKLIEDTAPSLTKNGSKKVEYDNFDFHKNIRRTGDTAILDNYVNVQLNVMYLNSIGIYAEKTTLSYSLDGDQL